jgi:uncharacterized iron-regulated membrane protein
MTRHFWVLVHRYAGLFMAFFLIVIGLTGSIIVFNPELDNWVNPLPKVIKRSVPMLDTLTLRERAQVLVPNGIVNDLNLNQKSNEPYRANITPRIDPSTGKPFELDVTVLMLDPYTGAELKREKYTDDIWPITHQNIMPLINRLHYQMALPGSVGSYLFGIVALIWTIDCFVSAYLTFPVSVRRKSEGGKSTRDLRQTSWLARWWNPSWLVKWRGSAYRINFDLHRAGGLWVWLMLLVIAWSSVGFNLGEQIYTPVMKAVFAMPDPFGDLPKVKTAQYEPGLSWEEAHNIAQTLMAEQARVSGFKVLQVDRLQFMPEQNVFFYNVRTDRDLMDEYGSTYLFFDGNSGKFAGLNLPTGQNTGGTIHTWIFALHMAKIWGLPFRIFVSIVGILVAMLSVTGVYIWLKKRNARGTSREKRKRLEAEVAA